MNPSFGLQVHLVISPDDFTSPAQDLPFALTYYCMTRIRHCKASRQHPITKVVRKDMAYNCWARGDLQLFPNCFGHSGGMCQSVLFGVINNLCIYMLIGAKYSQTWPFRGSIQLPTKTTQHHPPPTQNLYNMCLKKMLFHGHTLSTSNSTVICFNPALYLFPKTAMADLDTLPPGRLSCFYPQRLKQESCKHHPHPVRIFAPTLVNG